MPGKLRVAPGWEGHGGRRRCREQCRPRRGAFYGNNGARRGVKIAIGELESEQHNSDCDDDGGGGEPMRSNRYSHRRSHYAFLVLLILPLLLRSPSLTRVGGLTCQGGKRRGLGRAHLAVAGALASSALSAERKATSPVEAISQPSMFWGNLQTPSVTVRRSKLAEEVAACR